jgi:hypothetical protein
MLCLARDAIWPRRPRVEPTVVGVESMDGALGVDSSLPKKIHTEIERAVLRLSKKTAGSAAEASMTVLPFDRRLI